jgi:hypothetical protein
LAGQAQLRDGDQILICDVSIEFRHAASPKLVSGDPFAGSSLLGPLVGKAAEADNDGSSIMATLDVGKDGRASRRSRSSNCRRWSKSRPT